MRSTSWNASDAGQRLRDDQRHRRGRARDAGMAMHQQMPALPRFRQQVAAEAQQLRDVPGVGRDHACVGVVDHVVEPQFQPRVLRERAERGRHRPAGIEDRQHVADADIAMRIQLADAAHGNLEWRQHRLPPHLNQTGNAAARSGRPQSP
jgi:hypothetical protein